MIFSRPIYCSSLYFFNFLCSVEIAAGLQAHEDALVSDIVTVVPAPSPETTTTSTLLAE